MTLQVGWIVAAAVELVPTLVLAVGIILDPGRAETLVYEPGPITARHAHDNIRLALGPLTIAGFASPLGTCPLVSISVPVTNETIHVWTIPGVEDPYSELDDGWLTDYVAEKTDP